MLRVALWGVRTAGLAVVGVLTFLDANATRAERTTQVAAYALICAGVGLWFLADLPCHATSTVRRAGLPAALATVAAAGCLGATADGGGTSMVVFSAATMISAAELLSLPAALAITLLGVLATEVGGLAFGQGAGTLLGYPLLLAVGVLLGRNRASLRVQAEQARQLLAQHDRLRAEQRRADVLEERARIAREVHDVLAHSLGALGIQLQTVRALFTVHHDADRALEALATAQRMASGGLTETRRAVQALRADPLPLPDELARAAAEVAGRHHVRVACESSGTPVPLPTEATVALLRIAQEALVNAVKHAPGADIAVDLDYREDGVRLTVANPIAHAGQVAGREGGLHTADAGYGLTGMRERLLLLSGTLEAGEHDGRWVVTADLPRATAPPPGAAGRRGGGAFAAAPAAAPASAVDTAVDTAPAAREGSR